MSSGVSKCRFEVRVELTIELNDEDKARSLLYAIRPDDRTAPPPLSISEAVSEGNLVVKVSACIDGKAIGSLKNTVNEILDYVYAALRSIEVVEKRRV
jgi:tRNA threonylcarbamoyladenosine modification (KEOPS) complex  Pcc1 subunit